jgi:peptidyl-tRNA hydrolase, PTH1 family
MAAIRLIVGLGNPGSEYAKTRHNAGFWFLDELAGSLGARLLGESKLKSDVAKTSIAGNPVWLAKPQTFMNKSGEAVNALLGYYKILPEEILVAHDELDLDPGIARLKFDGGHGGQNGLRDIMQHLGHGKFLRLRIAIGHPGQKDLVTPWVLGRASVVQETAIRGAINAALGVIPTLVSGDINAAMKTLHTPAT